ncbi:MAG TPA: sigma-70 family RNA polymerase sigma factor [Enhygromyxa sp.]|nr:sigma-70 family RNA polymerase sigma factor [Enhygromyxa sp.]
MPTAKYSEPAPATDEMLAAIYREHLDFVWRSLRGLGFGESEAEDLAQDVFLVARRRLPDFDHSRPLRPWLFGILRRVASDRRRSAARTERRLRLLPPASPSDASPERSTVQAEAASFVEQFLATLDESRRMIFILSEAEGMSGTEIADALGINRNTVYTRLRAARQQFAAAISERRP